MVRIQAIELHNLQNVAQGRVDLNPQMTCGAAGASILGIYGANASGKSTLVQSLELLQCVLQGNAFLAGTGVHLRQGVKQAAFCFTFLISLGARRYQVWYDFVLERAKEADSMHPECKVRIRQECLKYATALSDGTWSGKVTLADCVLDAETLFTPKRSVLELAGDRLDEFGVAKKLAVRQGVSLFFSAEFIRLLMRGAPPIWHIVQELAQYGYRGLYVLGTRCWGPIRLNMGLPLYCPIPGTGTLLKQVYLSLNGPTALPAAGELPLRQTVQALNQVLCRVVPGLRLEVERIAYPTQADGSPGVLLEFFAVREREEIRVPLMAEADGIKKLVTLLSLFTAAYREPSLTLVVDELDEGLFEYLLDVLLRVFHRSGRGQLIFTAHNLRALEVLPKSCVMFTTMNPQHRYMRLRNVKTNNNLRDFYYHELQKGLQKERLYEPTELDELEQALRQSY